MLILRCRSGQHKTCGSWVQRLGRTTNGWVRPSTLRPARGSLRDWPTPLPSSPTLSTPKVRKAVSRTSGAGAENRPSGPARPQRKTRPGAHRLRPATWPGCRADLPACAAAPARRPSEKGQDHDGAMLAACWTRTNGTVGWLGRNGFWSSIEQLDSMFVKPRPVAVGKRTIFVTQPFLWFAGDGCGDGRDCECHRKSAQAGRRDLIAASTCAA